MATINGTSGNDTLTGNANDDDISGLGGDDSLTGGAGADTISGGAGNDTILGGPGADTILGGAGDDSIHTGVGEDIVDAGAGNDTITMIGGSTVTGGAGNDVFDFRSVSVGTITDFGAGSTNADDGDSTNNDFVDLSAFYTNQTEFEADLADDGILNQSDGSDYSDNAALTGSLSGLSGLSGISASSLLEQTGVTCFAAGTSILTDRGSVAIEKLQVSDYIKTDSEDYKPIRWIGSRKICREELQTNPKLHPVRIMAGALGGGFPRRDILVSRQHRMLVNSKITERMLGRRAVLVSAIKLTELPGIFVDESVTEVEYFHLLFDDHEIIFAEETPSESFYAGPEALKAVSAEMREEIITIIPEIVEVEYTPIPAAYIPKNKEQKQLVARHLKNNVPLLSGAR